MANSGKTPRRLWHRGWEHRAVTGITQEIHALDPLTERKYLRDFHDAFRAHQNTVSQKELNAKLADADVILLGDYHTLRASQAYAAHLLGHMGQMNKPIALGLEAVLASDQQHLDTWLQRRINEQQLRQALRFDEEWGYEWTPVFDLLLAARGAGCPVYGLDCGPRSNLRVIRRRDRHAATRIAEIRARRPKVPLLVLFGESHLAPGHLPAALHQLRPEDKLVTVLQNCDTLYWQLPSDSAGEKPVARIRENVFCVFTATLFEKYDSYRSYLNSAESGFPFPAPTCRSATRFVKR